MPSRAGARWKRPSRERSDPVGRTRRRSAVSNLVFEILLRLMKPAAAVLLGALLYWVLTCLVGAVGSVELGLLSFLAAAALILIVQESPI